MHLTWRLGYRETREPALQPRFRYGWARYGCSTVGRNAPRLAARLSRNARACTATSFPLWLGAVWVFHSGTQCTSPSGSVIAKRESLHCNLVSATLQLGMGVPPNKKEVRLIH